MGDGPHQKPCGGGGLGAGCRDEVACSERVFRRRHEFLSLGTPDNDQSLHFRRARPARVQRSRQNAGGGYPAAQHDRTELRELNVAFQRLPREQKEALRMIGIEEQSYEEAASATGCAVGTLKSRVHRARLNLRSEMHGEIRAAA